MVGSLFYGLSDFVEEQARRQSESWSWPASYSKALPEGLYRPNAIVCMTKGGMLAIPGGSHEFQAPSAWWSIMTACGSVTLGGGVVRGPCQAVPCLFGL